MNITLRLAAVATALIEGEPVAAAECKWVTDTYGNRVKAVQSAAGPRPDMRAGRNEQDRLALEYCAALPASLSHLAKAENLRRKLAAYQSTAWLHERALPEPPERHSLFWRMLKAHDSVPSVRSIRRKLAMSGSDALGVANTSAHDHDRQHEVRK